MATGTITRFAWKTKEEAQLSMLDRANRETLKRCIAQGLCAEHEEHVGNGGGTPLDDMAAMEFMIIGSASARTEWKSLVETGDVGTPEGAGEEGAASDPPPAPDSFPPPGHEDAEDDSRRELVRAREHDAEEDYRACNDPY